MTTSTKKDALLLAVLELAQQGANFYTLSISQIAQAAGIGKSTVYEYFENREDLLQQAIKHRVLQEVAQVEKIVKSDNSFKEKYMQLLVFFKEIMLCKMSSIQLTFSSVGDVSLQKILKEDAQNNKTPISQMENAMILLIKQGINENILNEEECKKYAKVAVKSSIVAYLVDLEQDGINKQEMAEKSYELLIKMLS